MKERIKNRPLLIFLFICITFSQIRAADSSHRYLVTAATSGLGSSICEALAAEGHSLILAGRNTEKLQRLKNKLTNLYQGNYTIELFDYSDLSSLRELGSRLKEQKLQGIVIIPPRVNINPAGLPSVEEWITMFNMGFISPLEVVKQALPTLTPEGAIVVISGVTSVHYLPQFQNSNVLRKMWVAEIKNLVHQLGERKIRVNCISPGFILTDYNRSKLEERASKNQRSIEGQLEEEVNETPLHKYGEPSDIAKSVAFLLSSKASHINGINLVIDGGLSKSY